MVSANRSVKTVKAKLKIIVKTFNPNLYNIIVVIILLDIIFVKFLIIIIIFVNYSL